MTTTDIWTKSSWQNKEALQQPNWPDTNKLQVALQSIADLPPLVFAGEIRHLKEQLAKAVEGKAFLLQGGDCSEEFA
ncbi:MAG: 3-deoxy-7-phosphoheptulonate synthase class II, partial [Candidatus Electrothrix sp. AR3]|nr:3-deoxy-7-phosphoheptulonate synthase class II [Candidatus Electrothrix sp. AR3]